MLGGKLSTWTALLATLAAGRVFWNPGDPIPRHNLEFEEMHDVASSWTPPVEVMRVDCPPRLEDEILYVRERYANPALDFTQEGNRLDIFRCEASWLRALEDKLLDLRPVLGDDLLAGFDQRALDALTVNGKLLALPTFLDATLLYYRKDLLDKYNLAVPRTWDELEAAARTIQQGERASYSDFWGLQWQGSPNEILTVLTYAFIGSHGGGSFVNSNGDIDIDNPQAKAAMERVRNWIASPVLEDRITPARVVNQHLHETKVPFLLERSAFLLDLTHITGEIHNFMPDGCDVFNCSSRSFAERVSYTHVPGSTYEQRRTTAWFWGWAVNRYTPEMDETVRVVRHLATRQQQLFKALNGDPPTLLELQTNSSATCTGRLEPNICTLPPSEMRFLDRNLPALGSRYFTLTNEFGQAEQGISPLVFTNMNRYLKEVTFTTDELIATWKCDIALALGKSEADHCEPCALGFVRLGPGGCDPCPAGFFAAVRGTRTCDRCLVGRYNNNTGSPTCAQCPDGKTTRVEAATDVSACECPSGSYLTSLGGGEACTECSEGIECAGGSALPAIKAGYMTLDGFGTMAPFRCLPAAACLGGDPDRENCRGMRSGIGCDECPGGTQASSDGSCSECSVANKILPWILGIPACILFFMVAGRESLMLMRSETTNLAVMTVGFGILVTVFQVLGTVNSLALPYDDGGASWLTSAGTATLLNPGHFGLNCATSRPLGNFAMRSLLPFGALLVPVAMTLANAFRNGRLLSFLGRGWGWTTCVDIIGRFLLVIYIVTVSTAAEPFQCFSHPQPNGRQSVLTYPGVLCFDDSPAHGGMIAFSVLSIVCLVIPYTCASAWASWVAPGYVLRHGFTYPRVLCFKFVLHRYKPGSWWWFNVHLVRQVLLAFATITAGEDPCLGCFYIVVVITTYTVAASWFQPWRTSSINALEVLCFMLLGLLMSAVGISFQPISLNPTTHNTLITVVVTCMGIGSLVFIAYVAMNVKQRGLRGVAVGVPEADALASLARRWHKLSKALAASPYQEVEVFVACVTPGVRQKINSLLFDIKIVGQDVSAVGALPQNVRKTTGAAVRKSYQSVIDRIDLANDEDDTEEQTAESEKRDTEASLAEASRSVSSLPEAQDDGDKPVQRVLV